MSARLPVEAAERHFEGCMEIWLRYMRGDLTTGGYSGLDSVCGRAASNFMAGEDDASIVYEKADKKLAETVNACVDSLPIHQRDALYRHYGISRLWRYGNLSLDDVVHEAMLQMRILIAKRC